MSAIDPGTGPTVEHAANDEESNTSADDGKSEKSALQDDRTAHTTWWFASTACPLIAATFGPIANGFSVCALAYNWREYIPPGVQEHDGIKIKDPEWLDVINGISLGFALCGNISLLLNMARRLRFSVAQPITITGFLMAGVLLIADMAALASSPDYFITTPVAAIPADRHALTMAFYFAIFAAAIYIIIGLLMCLTVYGANRHFYAKDFNLTSAQRTLMLQTMAYVIYLLLGALVFGRIEGWKYLDAVYWAQTTLLTIGLGDYAPTTQLARGLIIPFAVCGVIIVGLVIGSIRTLVLDRTKEKMAARIVEKRRESAVHNVDGRKQTIKISWFAQAEFSSDPSLTPAQRRQEEFRVMRKVQRAAERERRYFALAISVSFAILIWMLGALIFMYTERKVQGWTYFESFYFTFIVLMTIGYGDLAPKSNAGRAFFVMWTLLAIPSLTILISNMSDTVVKWIADVTEFVASFTVLPGKGGARNTGRTYLGQLTDRASEAVEKYTPFGKDKSRRRNYPERMEPRKHEENMLIMLADKLERLLEDEEIDAAMHEKDSLEKDVHFYNYILSKEMRRLQKDVLADPPKEYSWQDWEYYLKLMGDDDNGTDDQSDSHSSSNDFIPGPLKPADTFRDPYQYPYSVDGIAGYDHARPRQSPALSRAITFPHHANYDFRPAFNPLDGVVDRKGEIRASHQHPHNHHHQDDEKEKGQNQHRNHNQHQGHLSRSTTRYRHLRRKPSIPDDPLRDWSWLSDQSPLMSSQSEAEWILERLSRALVRELTRQRTGKKRRRPPPVGWGSVERGRKIEQGRREN